MNINKDIITPKINIDDKIIGEPSGGEPQGVTFKIFQTNKKYDNITFVNDDLEEFRPENIKECSSACFADLRRMFNKEKHNTLFYRVNKIHRSVINKTPAWSEILIKERIIPECCMSGTIILNIAKMTIPSIYTRLCMLRYLREYPKVVTGSLYLMGLGLDLFSAITFCASKLIWSSGHNFVSSTCKYGQSDSPYNKALINVGLIWAVRELVINGSKHSKYYLGDTWTGFETIRTIDNIAKRLPPLKVTLAELLRPDLAKTLKSSDEKYVFEFFNKYKEQQNAK